MDADAEAQVESFIARYAEPIAERLRLSRAFMHRRLPGAFELVYDNYNALAIAYGPSAKVSDVICSIAGYPRWISLFLAHGAELDDPTGVLKGTGSRVRHLVLDTAARLAEADVEALLVQAAARAKPLDPGAPVRTIVKSISAKQRPRRPA